MGMMLGVFAGDWGEGRLRTRRKGPKGFFVSLEAEETTQVKVGKHKRPANGGVHSKTGSKVQ